jgi:translation initiation factor 2 subunit 1
MRKQGMPDRNELVVCRITKLFPNSAYAELIEYQKTGMIHVSEVALKWVKDIREFIKEGQYVVCRVMDVEGDNVSLSIKRVRKEDGDRRLNEFKKERKAEKMLELVAKAMGKDLEDAYDEIGYDLEEQFGSLNKGFEFALKNPDLLKSKLGAGPWIDALVDTAKKSYSEKTYRVRAELKLVSYRPDGIDIIKKALKKAQSSGLEVKYVSAPVYTITGEGKNFKELKARVESVAEDVVKEMSSGGQAEYRIMED